MNQKYLFLLMALFLFGCPNKPCDDCVEDDIIDADYNPVAYDLVLPDWFDDFDNPADNPITEDGVILGRRLFYDTVLSANQNLSCSSCHQLDLSFTDGLAKSIGDIGVEGRRSTMSLLNLAYNDNGYYWDGRVQSLEEQVLDEVEDPLMLNGDWEEVLSRLQTSEIYPSLFRKAFGIEQKKEMSKYLVAKAIAQFERIMLSANSKYDKVVWENEGWFSNAEERGKVLFFDETSQTIGHPGCSHCHNTDFFTDNSFRNNGLDNPGGLLNFPDLGRGGVTGELFDNGKFRVPGLRNIELTAPYMHDGRFATLEEVLVHYSEGGHGAENEDIEVRPFSLTEQQKIDMISFLKTLTDTAFIRNEGLKSPF